MTALLVQMTKKLETEYGMEIYCIYSDYSIDSVIKRKTICRNSGTVAISIDSTVPFYCTMSVDSSVSTYSACIRTLDFRLKAL